MEERIILFGKRVLTATSGPHRLAWIFPHPYRYIRKSSRSYRVTSTSTRYTRCIGRSPVIQTACRLCFYMEDRVLVLPPFIGGFDPHHYRIVVFDQRGSSRSRPFAEITNNTTQLLVQDMEKLRKHLSVERWLVFGGLGEVRSPSPMRSITPTRRPVWCWGVFSLPRH